MNPLAFADFSARKRTYLLEQEHVHLVTVGLREHGTLLIEPLGQVARDLIADRHGDALLDARVVETNLVLSGWKQVNWCAGEAIEWA